MVVLLQRFYWNIIIIRISDAVLCSSVFQCIPTWAVSQGPMLPTHQGLCSWVLQGLEKESRHPWWLINTTLSMVGVVNLWKCVAVFFTPEIVHFDPQFSILTPDLSRWLPYFVNKVGGGQWPSFRNPREYSVESVLPCSSTYSQYH